MFQIADLLAIVAGAIAGAIAFLPFVFTLKPVLDDKQNADMLKGMVSLAVSAIALLVFTLVVFALFGEAFRMFLLGEAIGFVAFMTACTVRVAKALRDPHEVEREVVEIFEKLPDEINHLVSEFSSTPVVGDLSCGITQYSFWLIVSTIVLLIVLAVFKKKQTLVPKGFFVNGFEYIIEYVENDIGKGVVGENWKKHFPFLCSLFLFILINNMIGLIPGMKPGTGAIGSTAALAIFAFVYFIYYGCKAHGVIGYIKSLAPQGVSFPMNVLVWVVELFSTFLRLITLAVRLFCNMFAGHVVMGSFAIMASMFMQPLLQQVSAAHAVGALPSLAWLAILILIYAIELVVGAIQAYVFTVLTAVYVSEAEEVAEEE